MSVKIYYITTKCDRVVMCDGITCQMAGYVKINYFKRQKYLNQENNYLSILFLRILLLYTIMCTMYTTYKWNTNSIKGMQVFCVHFKLSIELKEITRENTNVTYNNVIIIIYSIINGGSRYRLGI